MILQLFDNFEPWVSMHNLALRAYLVKKKFVADKYQINLTSFYRNNVCQNCWCEEGLRKLFYQL